MAQPTYISRECLLMTIKWRNMDDCQLTCQQLTDRARGLLRTFMQEHADVEEVALERMVWMNVGPDDINAITNGG